MVPAPCHPDRPHIARGYCSKCYKRWLVAQPGYQRAPRPRTPEENQRRRERVRSRRESGEPPPRRIRRYREKHQQDQKLRRYGLTGAEYQALRRVQGDRCAICGREEYSTWRGRIRQLAIDHHHDSGKVRALLCTGCNLGLGAFNESPTRLRAAADYLERRL